MTEIIPALMPKSLFDLKEKLAHVVGAVKTVQLDIMDGKFVPAKSWPEHKKDDLYFEQIVGEEEGLPYWEELDFEIDLMVMNPAEMVDAWVAAGAKRLIIHIESNDAVRVFGELREKFPKGDVVGMEVGMAINIDTPNESLAEIADEADFIQCMGIARIGFQGEPFDERVLEKIEALRESYPETPISVDGGVNLDTARALLDAGATRLVSGSAIFEGGNIRDMIRTFNEL